VSLLIGGHEIEGRYFQRIHQPTQGAHSWKAHHGAMLTMSQPTLDCPPGTPAPESDGASLWRIHRETIIRVLRYAAVSLVATATSTLSLGVMVGLMGFSAVWSNVAATAIGTIPSFELNRRWVWKRTDQRSMLRQVVPFCALSLAGLVVSTVAVGVVSSYTSGWSRLDHTLAVEFANLAAMDRYGSCSTSSSTGSCSPDRRERRHSQVTTRQPTARPDPALRC